MAIRRQSTWGAHRCTSVESGPDCHESTDLALETKLAVDSSPLAALVHAACQRPPLQLQGWPHQIYRTLITFASSAIETIKVTYSASSTHGMLYAYRRSADQQQIPDPVAATGLRTGPLATNGL
jgi:hypothetical protein